MNVKWFSLLVAPALLAVCKPLEARDPRRVATVEPLIESSPSDIPRATAPAYQDFPPYSPGFSSYRGLGFMGVCCECMSPDAESAWNGYHPHEHPGGTVFGHLRGIRCRAGTCQPAGLDATSAKFPSAVGDTRAWLAPVGDAAPQLKPHLDIHPIPPSPSPAAIKTDRLAPPRSGGAQPSEDLAAERGAVEPRSESNDSTPVEQTNGGEPDTSTHEATVPSPKPNEAVLAEPIDEGKTNVIEHQTPELPRKSGETTGDESADDPPPPDDAPSTDDAPSMGDNKSMDVDESTLELTRSLRITRSTPRTDLRRLPRIASGR